MDITILPPNQENPLIHPIGNKTLLATAKGKVKEVNEDRLGCLSTPGTIRLAIADGHWGDAAADLLADYWLDSALKFPASHSDAVRITSQAQNNLYEHFGSAYMDPNKDFTPESSFVAAEINGNSLRLVSYGDCRFIIVNGGKIRFDLEIKETWLGAFSHLGIRNRLSLQDGVLFQQLDILPGDKIFMFTDGVDECIYGKLTLNYGELARLLNNDSLETSASNLMAKIFEYGAEDNASFAIHSR